MIKMLQKRFVVTAMAAVTVLIVLLLGTINAVNVIMVQKDVGRTLRAICENDASFERPPQPRPFLTEPKDIHDKLLAVNFLLVRFDADGNVAFVDASRMATVDETEAVELARKAVARGKDTGKIGKFRFAVAEGKPGTTMVLLDTSEENRSYLRVLVLSIGIGLFFWMGMLLLVRLLSRRAIRPVAENMEKQRQFVTDAGHELKTPLAILQANVDAMELYQGENKWSRNMKAQVTRLNGLTMELLTLSKLDEVTAQENHEDVSLRELAEESGHDFGERMALKGMQLHMQFQTEGVVHGNREQLARLLSILLDNACQYGQEDVWLSLKKDKKRIVLWVENTCAALPEVPPEKLFDRFYRGDLARTQKSGGYGIGLSAARAIAQANHGKIWADYILPNRIRFTVTLEGTSRKSVPPALA